MNMNIDICLRLHVHIHSLSTSTFTPTSKSPWTRKCPYGHVQLCACTGAPDLLFIFVLRKFVYLCFYSLCITFILLYLLHTTSISLLFASYYNSFQTQNFPVCFDTNKANLAPLIRIYLKFIRYQVRYICFSALRRRHPRYTSYLQYFT
jgi:hypothetical protein